MASITGRREHGSSESTQLSSLDDLTIEETPVTRLARALSIRSITSTASSFAQTQQAAALSLGPYVFHEIGAGYCGRVFEETGEPHIIKKAKQPGDTLWHDYRMQVHIFEQFSRSQSLHGQEIPRIPNPLYFVTPDTEEWWSANRGKFPKHMQEEERTPIICAERITPLPKSVREDLIDVFCPEEGRSGAKLAVGNKDCIVRLYLGRRSNNNGRPQRFFSLRNFSLHLDMATEIGLEAILYAAEMASGLAVCHWRAKVDANDVEFVLGSAPTALNFGHITSHQLANMPKMKSTYPQQLYKRTTHLWMLDFDKCNSIEMSDAGVDQAVKAAEDNDPYFPKPHKQQVEDQWLWEHFKSAYLNASNTIFAMDGIPAGMENGPRDFIKGWEEYRKYKIEAGLVDDN